MKTNLATLFLFIIFFGNAQTKFEREYAIKSSEVPQKALDFIAKCQFDKKIKWYAEESQDGKTIEAKSCKNNHKFSVEFDTNGNVLDIEKTVKWKQVSEEKRKKIEQSLAAQFLKYHIKKVQIQWQTDYDFYIDLINGKKENQINEFYEIVLKAKNRGYYEQYEVLLDANGLILKQLKFKSSNTDNLQF